MAHIFKVGDLVRCVDDWDNYHVRRGYTYAVEKLRIVGGLPLIDVCGEHGEIITHAKESRFELVEQVNEEEIKNTKRYSMADNRQLFDHIEEMFPPDYVRGFYIISDLKYITRYPEKNGTHDIKKASVYLERLKEYEEKLKAGTLYEGKR